MMNEKDTGAYSPMNVRVCRDAEIHLLEFKTQLCLSSWVP